MFFLQSSRCQIEVFYCSQRLLAALFDPPALTIVLLCSHPLFSRSPYHGLFFVQNAAQDDMGAFHPTPSEVFQLLWLSEAENILGASFLQLAFSAARTLGSGPHPLNEVTPTTTYQPSASKPTVAAVSVMAAGGRRPWGYSSGPFAEVSAMAPELFGIDSVGARGEEEGSNDAHTDEGYTVNQLEVRKGGVSAGDSTGSRRGSFGGPSSKRTTSVIFKHLLFRWLPSARFKP